MASDSVQRIKERLSIVDVVSSYVELHQAGKNFKGKSPFTNERTPSFYVSPDRGMYYCFSSNQGGDMFTFIQKMEGVEFKDALKILAQKAGVELVAEDPKKRSERDALYDVLEKATAFFEERRMRSPEVSAYLLERGVSKETIAKWRIGYAPGPPNAGWRELKEYLEKKGCTVQQLLKVGLIKRADAGKEPYDLFRDRVMFPICDTAGKPIAYSGRIFSKDSEAPKYVNSPETELFNKSEVLFGYDKAKQGIRTLDFALVVEGQFDVVLSHQAGYTNTVAVSGTALTAHHVMLLQRLSNRVVLALDADRAGIAAVRRAAELMLPRGMDIKVASMIGGKDPADMVREDVQKFRKIVGSAVSLIEYLLNITEATKKDERTFKLQVREEILPLIAKITNKIDQDHFENIVAERLKTSKEAVHFEVERFVAKNSEQQDVKHERAEEDVIAVSPKDERPSLQRKEELVQYFLALHSVWNDTRGERLVQALERILGEPKASLEAKIDVTIVSGLTFTIEQYLATTPQHQAHIEVVEKLNELVRYVIRQRIQEQKELLKLAESEVDEHRVETHLQTISQLQKDMEAQKVSADYFG